MNKNTEYKKLTIRRRAIQEEKDRLYAEYDALRKKTDAAHDAIEVAQREAEDAKSALYASERCLRSISPSSLPGTFRIFQEQVSHSKEKLARSKERLKFVREEFERLRIARNDAKQRLEAIQDEYEEISATLISLRTEQKADKNPDGIVRQVNMRLVNGNPEYLYNVFGADAEIVFSMKKPQKINVFFGPKDDRGHAVINSGGNVSYPDGGRVVFTNQV